MFQGLGDFRWFTGVVEDRMDPEKLGRVRVRIHGLHSEERIVNNSTGQGVPVDELPWATPIRDITDAAMDGIGDAPVGIVEGTWVVGFARDESMNDLFIMGTLGGKPQDPPNDKEGKKGFVDPRTAAEIAASPRKVNLEENRDPGYPPKKIPMGRYPQEKHLKKPDVNRLARNDELDETLLKQKKANRKKRIVTAAPGSWAEKTPPYAAKYPYNQVRETESGHVMEFDDTPGAERIHIWHRKGSYIEIGPEGDIQIRSERDTYRVTLKDDNLYAEGSINMTALRGVSVLAMGGTVNVTGTLGVNVVSTGPITVASAVSVALVAPAVTANGKNIG